MSEQKTVTESIVDAVVDNMRRERIVELNTDPDKEDRAKLEAKYGQVWNTAELSGDFDVRGFMAPYVVVKRKSDGQIGSMEFTHSPRFYFNFVADQK